jgi:hypothetical protein
MVVALGAGEKLVNESAQPDIHYQAYRQKNKQRGGSSIGHQG